MEHGFCDRCGSEITKSDDAFIRVTFATRILKYHLCKDCAINLTKDITQYHSVINREEWKMPTTETFETTSGETVTVNISEDGEPESIVIKGVTITENEIDDISTYLEEFDND